MQQRLLLRLHRGARRIKLRWHSGLPLAFQECRKAILVRSSMALTVQIIDMLAQTLDRQLPIGGVAAGMWPCFLRPGYTAGIQAATTGTHIIMKRIAR